MRPALFIPEMKFGSELLKEMQRKNQQMAIVIDEYGLLAGVVTIEDLVEEIVGEIGEEDRRPAPDVIRESGGTMVLRGSVPVDKIAELFGVPLETAAQHSNVTTIAGLLNSVAGHVPRTGEIIEFDGCASRSSKPTSAKFCAFARGALRPRQFPRPARCENALGRIAIFVTPCDGSESFFSTR